MSQATGPAPVGSLNRFAFDATVHCLTGCAIGEVLGMVIATALGWHDLPSILLSVALAFVFGYALTIRLLRAASLPLGRAARTAVVSDTVSIGDARGGDRHGRPPVLGTRRPSGPKPASASSRRNTIS